MTAISATYQLGNEYKPRFIRHFDRVCSREGVGVVVNIANCPGSNRKIYAVKIATFDGYYIRWFFASELNH